MRPGRTADPPLCRGAQTARTWCTVVSQAWMAHWTHCAQAVHADAKRPATPTWQ
ncbi:hypothetical protein XAPC_1253 [Xanthomonas citri pv. punicae str. LMG 859]|nr:hypothetical protein XAPC_1253 [Xanthomonas citri pv. punicae str. LMG 859]